MAVPPQGARSTRYAPRRRAVLAVHASGYQVCVVRVVDQQVSALIIQGLHPQLVGTWHPRVRRGERRAVEQRHESLRALVVARFRDDSTAGQCLARVCKRGDAWDHVRVAIMQVHARNARSDDALASIEALAPRALAGHNLNARRGNKLNLNCQLRNRRRKVTWAPTCSCFAQKG